MSSRGAIETEALLVRSVDYGETDRIVTLVTAALGKVSAIARGAKRSRRRFGGALQPFQLLRVNLGPRPRGDLLVLSEAEVVRVHGSLAADPRRYAYAAFGVELVRELCPWGEEDTKPLALLCTFLERLDDRGAHPRLLAFVMIQAFAWAGLLPSLDRCVACGRQAPKWSAACFDVGRGVVCTACGGASMVLTGRVRRGLLVASELGEDEGCEPDELRQGVLALLTFARIQLGKQLRSEPLVRQYLA